ncbi:hypothetical protein [Devosia sp.]|uniref:hypothetical protein n=1 Tax=Devosia sp. TaxID=1871048 RepID=UPI001A0E09D3|nr:hypothetical protein [Devosia sp.]MBE0579456.1 hypothetical protein [Devosia sp.]
MSHPGNGPFTKSDQSAPIVLGSRYASNTGSRSWEEDILGRDILPSGSSVVINIDDGSGYCKYDFLAVFEDGDEVVSNDNNVCELSDFNFTD